MQVKDLRAQSLASLKRSLEEAERRLQELRFQLSSNQLSQVRGVREARRQIARIKTILREKETEQVSA